MMISTIQGITITRSNHFHYWINDNNELCKLWDAQVVTKAIFITAKESMC